MEGAMSSLYRTILISSSLAILAACAQGKPAERPPVAPAATVVGEPVNCISRLQVRDVKIRDDRTIDFIGSGGRVWRNTLASRCPGLTRNIAIAYKSSTSQICSVDVFYPVETLGGMHRGAGCHLGKFVPVELKK